MRTSKRRVYVRNFRNYPSGSSNRGMLETVARYILTSDLLPGRDNKVTGKPSEIPITDHPFILLLSCFDSRRHAQVEGTPSMGWLRQKGC
ncbi:hypothetical protein EVAR_13415_1 [Eumeta japonica]|uniref:Uncharacterized protein n=1 Tax=Eumeta variegata TaxID=151549 RepID=A0A4C1V758_EUMVA|nr:hypothetical protein EVAR_13415_1 [Eumeta japonica]